jgi:hypothetical protein
VLEELRATVPVTIIGEVSDAPAVDLHLPEGEKVELLLDELRHAHGALADLFA